MAEILYKIMKSVLKVKGMHCKSCEVLIKDSLEEIGVKASVDYKKGLVEIDFDGKKTSMDKIKQIISENGYNPE